MPRPRILVIGDVMTDIIVRPEGPLARGSDRRASIAFLPGGSAANQAAWLASFGVGVDFVGRVGAADVQSETARLKAVGVTPWLAGDAERPTGRLIALIDASGERSFLTDRGANDALRSRRHPRRADRGSGDDPSLRLFVLRARPTRGRSRCDAARRREADQRRSGLGGILARGRAREFSQPGRGARRSCSPTTTRRRSSPARTTPRPNARGSPRSIRSSSSSAARRAARRRRARCAGAPRRRRSRRSTPPAPATPSSPPFSPRALPAPTFSPRSSAPPPPARPLRRLLGEGRKASSVRLD